MTPTETKIKVDLFGDSLSFTVQGEVDKSKSSRSKTSIWSFSACWSTGRPVTGPAMIRAAGKVENYSHLVEAANREMSGFCLHVPPKALR